VGRTNLECWRLSWAHISRPKKGEAKDKEKVEGEVHSFSHLRRESVDF
jgi:hypothetical protein